MTRHMKTFWNVLLGLFCAGVGLWLVAPSLIVVPLSFTDRPSFAFPPTGWSTRWYHTFFEDPAWISALKASLEVGILVAVFATLFGTASVTGLGGDIVSVAGLGSGSFADANAGSGKAVMPSSARVAQAASDVPVAEWMIFCRVSKR